MESVFYNQASARSGFFTKRFTVNRAALAAI